MTALQDWLGLRSVDQSAVRDLVCRPLRAVLNVAESRDYPELVELPAFTTMCAGIERC